MIFACGKNKRTSETSSKLTEVTVSDKLESLRAAKEVYICIEHRLWEYVNSLDAFFLISFAFHVVAAFQRFKLSYDIICWFERCDYSLLTRARSLCRDGPWQNLLMWFRSTGLLYHMVKEASLVCNSNKLLWYIYIQMFIDVFERSISMERLI